MILASVSLLLIVPFLTPAAPPAGPNVQIRPSRWAANARAALTAFLNSREWPWMDTIAPNIGPEHFQAAAQTSELVAQAPQRTFLPVPTGIVRKGDTG